MAPITMAQEMQANKRKRDLDEQGKRKRTRRDRKSGVNGDTIEGDDSTTAEAKGQKDDAMDINGQNQSPKKKHRSKGQADKAVQLADRSLSKWKISKPMGGRILNIDPILTNDEKHLILVYNTSLQIYSAADSLLVRKIHLSFSKKKGPSDQPAAARVSPTNPNLVWVASHTGHIWLIDWTAADSAQPCFRLDVDILTGLAVDSMTIGRQKQDVLFVSALRDDAWEVLACDVQSSTLRSSKTVLSQFSFINELQASQDGSVLVASAEDDVLLGTLRLTGISSFDDLMYEFFTLDCSDNITCLDMRVVDRVHVNVKSQKLDGDEPVVDIVVGCARGSVLFYNDLLPQLRWLQSDNKKSRRFSLQPRKFHWHRKAVHAVKWSRDGNYILSGGSESTLVLWQLDTGKKDFLPHLSATIENIVVSARGSSYVLHLDDNSSMILSTAEMKPTTYVSGVQTLVSPRPFSKDDLVTRVGQQFSNKIADTPAAVHPSDPSRMLMCVGNGQQASISGSGPSMPMIQTVDLGTVQSLSKQALARTNPSDVNITTGGHSISEPRVTAMSFSQDGAWLATTDEWQPPAHDLESLEGSSSDRREVFLKFWAVSPEDQTLELIARVNAPHFAGQSEPVFDLAADPSSHTFATVGRDGVVRLWRPSVRQRDGIIVKGKQGQKLQSWSCSQAICVHGNEPSMTPDAIMARSATNASGALCFSEDGSLLVCAIGGIADSVVYIIDTESGNVRHSLHGLSTGDIRSVKMLSSRLIVLSDSLMVYDLVLDELNYGIQLRDIDPKAYGPAISAHLAVDQHSSSFAVAVSRAKQASGPLRSELAIFSPEHSEPDMTQSFPHPVSALVPALRSSGFLVLDATAQLWSVSQNNDTDATFAAPLADLSLDAEEETTQPLAREEAGLADNVQDDVASEDEMDVDGQDGMVDDEIHPAVVAPQKLASLFDSAPSFAMPPIEDMFYQVAHLFSSKSALSQTS